MPESSEARRSMPRGPEWGRLVVLSVVLVLVVLGLWLAPRMFSEPEKPAAPQQPEDRAPAPMTTRPAPLPTSRATSLPALSEGLQQLVANIRDGSRDIEVAVVDRLCERLGDMQVVPVAGPAELTADLHGRRVQLTGKLIDSVAFSSDPDAGEPQHLARLRMIGSGPEPRNLDVWVPVTIFKPGSGLVPGQTYRVTGIYYKLWNSGLFELDETRGRYGAALVVPVILANASGIQPATTTRAAGEPGPFGIGRGVFVIGLAVVLIVAYVALRMWLSVRKRPRHGVPQSPFGGGPGGSGAEAGGLFRLPTHLRRTAVPAREPADEKKIASARDALAMAEQINGTPAILVDTGRQQYQVHVAAGLLERCGDMLARLFAKPRNTALITDEHVGKLYAGAVRGSLQDAGFQVTELTVPAGEASKSLEQAAKLYGPMLAADMDRNGLLVALGGGMVGDLAGFVAATYMRGIDFVQMPTSLLAQVDASVGGKVAVNLPEGKNLVGAFHQPRAVLADIATLATLPNAQYASGLAEVVKHGVIRDEALFGRLEDQRELIAKRDPDVMADIVAANCRIKAEVVSADEKESGLRAILNYGHTVGHALESLGHYRLSHGAAVSLGMLAASHIAAAKGLIGDAQIDRQRNLLAAFGLPVTLAEVDVDAVLATMRHDKKARGGVPRFVLPTRIGRVELFDDVTNEQVREALAALRG